MSSFVRTRRELLAWMLAAILAITAVVVSRPNGADAGVAGPTTQVVYIATGANFPDALGAAATAALGLGPVLLVQQNALPTPTLTELNRLQPERIVIVGGTAVVSDGVKTQLEGLTFNPTVTRIAGGNRFETAANLSAASFPTTGYYPRSAVMETPATLILTTAFQNYGDALAIVAPQTGWVILSGTLTFRQDGDTPCTSQCGVAGLIRHVNTAAESLQHSTNLNVSEGDARSNIALDARFPVTAGTHTFNLQAQRRFDTGAGELQGWFGSLTAIWVPFDWDGS